jgi:hypothetical protein
MEVSGQLYASAALPQEKEWYPFDRRLVVSRADLDAVVGIVTLCFLTEHHAMKAYWGVEVAKHILDLGTRWG